MAYTPPVAGSGPAPAAPTWQMPPPQPPYTWADWVAASLFALVGFGLLVNVVAGSQEPDQGIVTDLRYTSGAGSSCSYIGRITTCRQEIDFDDLDTSDGFELDDLGCHQVEFRSPYHWVAGYDCVSEEAWRDLEIGDAYPPR